MMTWQSIYILSIQKLLQGMAIFYCSWAKFLGQMTSLKSIFLLLRSKVQDSYVRNPQDKKHSYFHYWSRKSKHCWKRGQRARDCGFGWPGLDKDYKSAWLMPELLGVEGEFQILLRPIRINYISVPNRNGYVRTKENDPKKPRVNPSRK